MKLDARVGPVGDVVEGGRLGGCGRQRGAFGLCQLQDQQAHCKVHYGEDNLSFDWVQSSPLLIES